MKVNSLKIKLSFFVLLMPLCKAFAQEYDTLRNGCILISPSILTDTIFIEDGQTFVTIAKESPEYPGGMNEMEKYLLKNMVYPQTCLELGVQGNATVSCVIGKSGNIAKAKMLESIHPEMDQVIIDKVMQMPTWSIGKINGKPQEYTLIIPLRFYIDDNKKGRVMLMSKH